LYNFMLTPMVKKLILANVVMYFLSHAFREFYPYLALSAPGLFGHGLVYQLITYQFTHDLISIMHLFGNMLLLFFLGPAIEEIWGSKRFIIVYLTAGVFAGLAEILINPQAQVVGASGSVMAVFTAYALYYPNREMLFMFFIPVKIKYLFMFYLVSDLLGAMPGRSDGIAHFAHLGGVFVSFIYIKYFHSSSSRSSFGNQGWSPSNYSKNDDFLENLKDKFNSLFSSKQGEKDFTYHNSKKANNPSNRYDPQMIKDYRDEVDILLDKINQVGYLQLSDDERKRLEEASTYLKKYDSH
jgi:membrane associated rhomboid family serine protease